MPWLRRLFWYPDQWARKLRSPISFSIVLVGSQVSGALARTTALKAAAQMFSGVFGTSLGLHLVAAHAMAVKLAGLSWDLQPVLVAYYASVVACALLLLNWLLQVCPFWFAASPRTQRGAACQLCAAAQRAECEG